jgi:hypothetical protein
MRNPSQGRSTLHKTGMIDTPNNMSEVSRCTWLLSARRILVGTREEKGALVRHVLALGSTGVRAVACERRLHD